MYNHRSTPLITKPSGCTTFEKFKPCFLTPAPPVSPSNVKAEKIDSGTKIKVSWEPLTPEEARGFVTSYTIAYTKEGELRKRQMSEKIVPGTQNSTIIEGLDPNQDYSVSVQASTKAGVGKISEPTSTKGINSAITS